jgi:hypothetical protein
MSQAFELPDKTTQVQPSDFLHLNVVLPHICVTPVSLSGQSLVRIIQDRFPGRIFIYRGQVLDVNRPFSFYGMQPKDSVVAIASDSERTRLEQWLSTTSDFDTFGDMIHSLMEQTSRRETQRIQDIRAMRLECRPRQYRRFMASFLPSIDVSSSSKKGKPTIIPDAPLDLSCDPLPPCY